MPGTMTYDGAGKPLQYVDAAPASRDKTRRIATLTNIDVLTTSYTGVFGTIGSLTVPTTFTAGKGPIAYVA